MINSNINISNLDIEPTYNSLNDVFETLNRNNVDYVILRNFEDFESSDFLNSSHPDIDILCSDKDTFIDVLKIKGWHKRWNRTNGRITINGKNVSIDVRCVGDNYYCLKWQNDILSSKIRKGNFYIPSLENYFYSLLYHTIIQKEFLTDDYIEKLNEISESIGFKIDLGKMTTKDIISLLENYMVENDYQYVYPRDKRVPLHKSLINRGLIIGGG